MASGTDNTVTVASFAEVLRAPLARPVLAAAMLSTWGDHIARITAAAVVFSWTGSALATAATFAVALVASPLGRTLLAPIRGRVTPRACLIGSHLIAALLVGVLMVVVATTRSVLLVLTLVALIGFVAGLAVPGSRLLLTAIVPDRRLHTRAVGLSTLAVQVNQAIGLAVGGAAMSLIGGTKALVLDLLTFVVGAVVLITVKPPQPTLGPGAAPLPSRLADLRRGWHQVRGSRALTAVLGLLVANALAIAAPAAVALPYAAQQDTSSTWGGLLMAAPILGAVVGLLLIGRLPAERQASLVLRLALLTPLPLLVTILEPPLPVVWLAWFGCGALQCHLQPLQSAFTRLAPTAGRGGVLGLAGVLSVVVTGAGFVVAGWICERTTPAATVGICAVVTLGVLVLLAAKWPLDVLPGSARPGAETAPGRPTRPT
ncbi:MFS transporter [Phycicoccus sp. Soil802]|uniref:MFS transporter n=1 Tax=Phycicoccus sp. Soil802 TaxID=1736414 RepID=UPI0007036F0C|nr:MFS transporter [Phycicoccus sp. Soil802]KRF22665.1 hypothetical protein ASG91_14745 [Phycicoccus sp. Soil802]